MEFFSCNNCKRYRRRTSSSGEEENEDVTASVRQRTSLRRGSGGGTPTTSSGACGRISLCCATAVMYCYAARPGRRESRSRSAKAIGSGRRAVVSQLSAPGGFVAVGGNLELPQLHHSSSPKSRSPAPKGSILKNSSSSGDFGATNGVNGNTTPSATLTSRTGNWFIGDEGTTLDIRRSASPEKRASFNEAVDVIVADETGRQVVADSVRLKPPSNGGDDSDSEPDVGRRTRGCGYSTTSSSGSRVSSNQKSGSASGRRKQHQTYVYPPASRCRHAFSLASADVERRPDGSRYLRAVIRPTTSGARDIGRDGDAIGTGNEEQDEAQRQRRSQQQQQQHQQPGGGSERVVVRAAAKGSRLVVGAYRPEPLGDGTNYLRQYVDRFPLPRVIETQTIRADMQPTGVLVVTAAINESSDTDTD